MPTTETFRVPESDSGVSYIHPSSVAANNIYVFAVQKSGIFQVFTYDFQNDTSTQVTSGNGDSFVEAVSRNGQLIVIRTFADNLDGTLNNPPQLILRDRNDSSGVFTLITENSSNNEADEPCINAALSPNDRFVAFQSRATNLDGTTNGHFQIFRKEIGTSNFSLISKNSSGNKADSNCANPTFESEDEILFDTDASNFPESKRQVYRRNVANSELELVTDDETADSFNPEITENGIVFQSRNPVLFGQNEFLKLPTQIGLKTNTFDILSKGKKDRPSFGVCRELTASKQGNQVAYSTRAGNILQDFLDKDQIVGRSIEEKENRLVSAADSSVFPDGENEFPAISGTGSDVIFESESTDLISNDTNNERDIFFRENWQDTDLAPVAKIKNSNPQILDLDDPILLDGTDSYDPEAEDLTYLWEVTAKPSGAQTEFSNKDQPKTYFKLLNDTIGTYTVRLTVEDPARQQGTDTIDIPTSFRKASLSAEAIFEDLNGNKPTGSSDKEGFVALKARAFKTVAQEFSSSFTGTSQIQSEESTIQGGVGNLTAKSKFYTFFKESIESLTVESSITPNGGRVRPISSSLQATATIDTFLVKGDTSMQADASLQINAGNDVLGSSNLSSDSQLSAISEVN